MTNYIFAECPEHGAYMAHQETCPRCEILGVGWDESATSDSINWPSNNLAIPPHLFISEKTNIAIENMLKDFHKQFANSEYKKLYTNQWMPPEDKP